MDHWGDALALLTPGFMHQTNHTTYVYISNPEDMLDPFHSNQNFMAIILTHAITFIVGVIGNSAVIATWARGGKIRSPTASFLVSLACADLLLLIIFMPLETLEYFVITWDHNGNICKLSSFVELLSGMSSILNLVAVSVERFLVIVYPMQARRWCTVTKSRRSLLIVWLLAIVFAAPPVFNKSTYSMTYYNNETAITAYYCFEKNDNWAIYSSIYELMLLFVIPALLMIFCYSRVIQELWTSTRVITILTNGTHLPQLKTSASRSYLVRWSTNKNIHQIATDESFITQSQPAPSGAIKNDHVPTDTSYPLNCIWKLCCKPNSNQQPTMQMRCCPHSVKQYLARQKCMDGKMPSQNESDLIEPNGKWQSSIWHRFKCNHCCSTSNDVHQSINQGPKQFTSETMSLPATFNYKIPAVTDVRHTRRQLYCQVIKMLLFIVILFHICWGPRLVFNVIKTTGLGQFDKFAYSARVYFYLLSFIHSALNPFVYGFMSSNFRRMMTKPCKHRVTRNTVNNSLVEAMPTSLCLAPVGLSLVNNSLNSSDNCSCNSAVVIQQAANSSISDSVLIHQTMASDSEQNRSNANQNFSEIEDEIKNMMGSFQSVQHQRYLSPMNVNKNTKFKSYPNKLKKYLLNEPKEQNEMLSTKKHKLHRTVSLSLVSFKTKTTNMVKQSNGSAEHSINSETLTPPIDGSTVKYQ